MTRVHAVVVRTSASLAAIAILARVLLLRGAGLGHGDAELVLHGVIVLTGVVVALLAHGRQGEMALRTLAAVLVVTVALVEAALLALYPQSLWQWGAILMAVQVASPFIGAWSWRWQAGIAGGTVLAAVVALMASGAGPVAAGMDMVVVLAAAGIAATVGAHFIFTSRDQLATSEERYRALFRWAGDAIVVLDAHGAIVESNAAFDAMVRGVAGAAVGAMAMSYMDPIQPGGRRLAEAFREHLDRVIAGETVSTVGRLRLDGDHAVEVAIRLSRVTREGGPPLVQAILRDRTVEARLARQAEREARLQAMRRLAGGIAHEFNNLLAGVRTDATLLRDRARDADQAAQLDDIVEATRRGADLARELLQFGQQQTLHLDRVEPIPVLATIQTFARAALRDTVQVETHVPPWLPDVRVDREAVLHAALQLTLNARDAVGQGGTLTIAAAPHTVTAHDAEWPDTAAGDYLRLTFRDSGCGMDEDTLDRVFEPFFSTRPLWAARGTGLSVVYGIVRAHHGAIRLQSQLGRGTTVHMLFPVWRERPSPTVARRSTPARASVLLVDDDDGYRTSVARALAASGYVVIEAADADEAVTAYETAPGKPEIVLLDYVMPGGGPQAFEALRALRPDLPVLICTGYAGDEEGRLAAMLDERDVRLLRKPFDLQVLFAEVAYLLGETD